VVLFYKEASNISGIASAHQHLSELGRLADAASTLHSFVHSIKHQSPKRDFNVYNGSYDTAVCAF
jgi:hypothetical protein